MLDNLCLFIVVKKIHTIHIITQCICSQHNLLCQQMVFLDLKVDSDSIRSHRESPELVQIVRAASQEYRLKTRTASQIILIVKPSNVFRQFI